MAEPEDDFDNLDCSFKDLGGRRRNLIDKVSFRINGFLLLLGVCC